MLSRKKGFKIPDNTIVVSRPTRWGNPFKAGVNALSAQDAVRKYRDWLFNQPDLMKNARNELKGRNLACWCKDGHPCHADILLWYANGE